MSKIKLEILASPIRLGYIVRLSKRKGLRTFEEIVAITEEESATDAIMLVGEALAKIQQ